MSVDKLASFFVDEKLTSNAADKGRRLVRATILLNGFYYQAIVTRPYNPKTGRF